MKQFKIAITCDEGFVADSLRELANVYEESLDEEMSYETYHMFAEIKNET